MRFSGLREGQIRVIRPQQVLGWRSTGEGGQTVLTQFRYTESVDEDDGEFGVKSIDQIRVLWPGRWATYRKGKDTSIGAEAWADAENIGQVICVVHSHPEQSAKLSGADRVSMEATRLRVDRVISLQRFANDNER